MSRKLDPKEAAAVMLSAGLQPLEPYRSTKDPWPCQCLKCKGIVSPRLDAVKRGKTACRLCANAANGISQTKPSEAAVAIMRKAELEPLEPYVNSKAPWKSKCLKCGSIVQPRLGSVQRGVGGCKV